MTIWPSNSKADTALYLDADLADIFEDYGPERTNLVDQSTYADEANSARTAIDAPRNITVKLRMRSGWSGTIIELGNAVAYSWRILLSGGLVYALEGGSIRAAVNVPGAAVEETVLIHWSTRMSGASVVSELAVYNYDQDAWAFVTATHADATPTATHKLTVAARFGGAGAYSGGLGAILAVHIGRRFHSTAEASEDWVLKSTPATFTGYDRSPVLTGPAAELAIAGEGSLAGPSLIWAGAATRQAANRTTGPFVNATITTPAAEYNTNYPAQFYRPTPDSWGLLCIRYLWHGYLGPRVNVARVRIHVTAYDLFGGGTISPLRFRSYSIANLPTGPNADMMTFHRGAVVSLTSPSAAGGEWIDLGLVRLARSSSGLSFFALGFLLASTASEGAIYSTTWELNAITVDPFAKSLDDGGQGDIDEKAP